VAVFRRQRQDPAGTQPGAPDPAELPDIPLPRAAPRGALEFDSVDDGDLEHQIGSWVDDNRRRLGDVLLELGSIDPDELLEALQRQRELPDDAEAKRRLGQILLELGSINETTLARGLARQFDVPFVDLSAAEIDPEAVARVPEQLARRHRVLPVRVEDDRVYLASADPLDTVAIEELTRACRRIGLTIGARSDIERLIDKAYNALDSADDIVRAFELAETPNVRSADESLGVDENAPVVQVVNRILTQGVRSGSSDIHIEPAADAIRVRYRVDGAMTEAIRLPAAMGSAITSRLKVMAELNIVERRRPQDGQFSVLVDDRPVDVRVSVVPTISGEKTVMRLLDKNRSLISMRDLGMIPAVEGPFLRMARAPLGMLLCSGPTGSGKTTTLYAALNEVNDPTKNVVTIEDPVEYQFEGVTQMQVSDTGMGFADGLRGILRQDPDVILVGEIRDEETARIAMQAALTGHLVLSSLHAIDAVSAVQRFIDMGIEPFLVASAINGVVAQRLLRRLCVACREPVAPSSRDVALVAEHAGGPMPQVWFRPRGCNLCNQTGYRGRIGVYELLEFTEAVRELVVGRASHLEIRNVAVAEGMRTMQEQAFLLVVDGVSTVEEVLRSVYATTAAEAEPTPALGPGPAALLRRRADAGADGAAAATGPADGPAPGTADPEGPPPAVIPTAAATPSTTATPTAG
jgi:type IV pilus assembly protein PilB